MRLIKYLLPTLILVITITSCKKKEDGYQKATIIGPDFRFCICCGGTFIEIGDETYRFYEKLGFDQSELPLDVKVKWRPLETTCLGDEIIIESVKYK